MFKLNLLRLRETKRAGDVGERLLREDDGAGAHRANGANEEDVFDGLRKALQAAAILFQKSQTRAVNLAINQEPDQAFMAQAGSKRQLPLRHIKCGLCVAERTFMQVLQVFVRSV